MKLQTKQPPTSTPPKPRTYEDTLNNLARYLQQKTNK